jgi:signal transduction histidine kinase
MIRTLATNLLDNAVRYAGTGATLTLRVAREGDAVVLTAADDGVGVAEEDIPRLFERFFRASNAKGRVSGMGLGLFIAREIVVRHGGSMWVESEEGHGSLFGVALPLAEDHEQPEPVTEAPEPVAVT